MCALEVRPVIPTERLRLRGPTLDDAERLAGFACDAGVSRNLSNMPHPYARQQAEDFLGGLQGLDPGRDMVFAIDHREHGFLGMLGFHEKKPGRPELGYWLGRPFWGQGYATEAVSAALTWAKAGWKRRVVWAGHFADNPASGQVLVKSGFLYTGEVELRASAARPDPVETRMMVWLA